MSVVVVGLHERDAPLDVLECVAVADRDLPKALSRLCDSPHLSEAVVLSTCMRTEVYAVLERFHDGLADINAFFHSRAATSHGAGSAIEDGLSVAYDDAAARHLFEVAAGADSAVLGEGEILRQVRRAAEQARAERAAGPVLGGLFRHALEVGKRVRTETAIARGVTSLAHVAVALVTERNGGTLEGLRVVVVGAGEMGESLAAALSDAPGRAEVVVLARDGARAQPVAEAAGGRAGDLRALASELAHADVLLTATSADAPLLDVATTASLLGPRGSRPLLVVDAAVPRDVEPGVRDLAGVTLLDLDDLRAHAESQMQARRGELDRVREIVDEELERYRTGVLARSVAPVVASLRAACEQVRVEELARIGSRLDRLDADDRAAIEAFSRRLVAKLLHEPTVQVKSAAGSARGERLAEALRQLFAL